MTSELRVDNLKGSTTGGSINVLGEGTSATTNLQQGLNKAFINHNAGSSIRDSFNVGSLTDSGTGKYKTNFTNSFSNNDYVVDGISGNFFGTVTHYWIEGEASFTTSSCELTTLIVSNTSGGGTNTDSTLVNTSFSGDLA